MKALASAVSCCVTGQVDAVEAAESRAIVEAEASKIAADNADGLGEERRNAVLAEAEAAAAQGDHKDAFMLLTRSHELLRLNDLLGCHLVISQGKMEEICGRFVCATMVRRWKDA